jgi:HEAT repeat protein
MSRILVLGTLLLLSRAAGAAEEDPQAQLVSELVEVLRNRSGTQLLWSRIQAAQTLGKLGQGARSAVPALAEFLDDPRRNDPLMIDEAVVRTLGRIGRPARTAIPAMVRVSGKDFDLERLVQESINGILLGGDGGDVVALMRSLHDRDDGTRLRAAKALGDLGPAGKTAVPALIEALHDADPDVRHQALQSLRRLAPATKPTEAEVAIHVQDLRDADPAVRLHAVKSLARMGQALPAALPALLDATKDGDPDVRRLANDLINQVQPR